MLKFEKIVEMFQSNLSRALSQWIIVGMVFIGVSQLKKVESHLASKTIEYIEAEYDFNFIQVRESIKEFNLVMYSGAEQTIRTLKSQGLYNTEDIRKFLLLKPAGRDALLRGCYNKNRKNELILYYGDLVKSACDIFN